ncbi:MAG: ribosomal-protein-alanine N-acetyltransferase [Vicingaceae bacterium]|jgi:ribosomal-protein-alanine N-acetyltransferase
MEPKITFPEIHPTLKTHRLELKPPSLSDASEFFEIRSDIEFMKYVGQYPIKKISKAEEYIQRIIDGFKTQTGISWKICEKGSDKLIGYIGFWSIDYTNFRTEIGYGLHPNFHRKGYATEALNAMTHFVFNELGLHSIEANADVKNIATIKLLEKCGFKKEAHFKENFFFDGTFLDSAIYCLVKQ